MFVLQGNELTRVTVVDSGGRVCYETLVVPDNEIIDFNTRYQFVNGLSRSPLTLYR
jgi:RNA exonuclease 1